MKAKIMVMFILIFLFSLSSGGRGDSHETGKNLPVESALTPPKIEKLACQTTMEDTFSGKCKEFYEPEKCICLESISFNHKSSINFDAIDIRMNDTDDVRIPEWEKGEKSFPAAYIQNKQITVKAVFSAADGIFNAKITAVTTSGYLDEIIAGMVGFDRKSSLGSKVFHVTGTTPSQIRIFNQEWQWYCLEINNKKICPPKPIGRSKNKIFIVLSEPQYPWKRSGNKKPWAEVLDLACCWANGQTTLEGAAKEITRHLYNESGGQYGKDPHYTNGCTTQSFDLIRFLMNLENKKVGGVNCCDMGKALVTFSNVIGCGLLYRLSNKFGKLYCIRTIGNSWWQCSECFVEHAFGSIGDRIFDASLKVDPGNHLEDSTHVGEWMINITWYDYRKKLVKDSSLPGYPDKYFFDINKMNAPQKNVNTN
jgi:hypothetical protein